MNVEQLSTESLAYIKNNATAVRTQGSRPIIGQQYSSRYEEIFLGIRAQRYAYWGLGDQIVDVVDVGSLSGNLPFRFMFTNQDTATQSLEIGSIKIEAWY